MTATTLIARLTNRQHPVFSLIRRDIDTPSLDAYIFHWVAGFKACLRHISASI
jgi:hypothetical protein